MFRPGLVKGFRPEAFFRPKSVLLVGGDSASGRAIAANMAGFKGRFAVMEAGVVPPLGPGGAFDLAVLACAPDAVAGALLALGQAGTWAAVCATPAPGLAAAARAAGVRVLGPSSFGIMVPALGLDASAAPLAARPGKVALVSQSAALCRAVLDWAGPNGVGFSHVIGTGGNVDTGFSLSLDWLSRDRDTGAILLDIRSIRDRHAFLAAARAAARLRPVVALRAGGRLQDPSGQADEVFAAALRRVGVVQVSGLANFLGAAEVLTRARPPRNESLAIATNAVGPGHMAADAAVAAGIPLLALSDTDRALLQLHLPDGPADPGIVWTGADRPIRVAEAAAMLAGMPGTGGIVAILSPTGPDDAAAVAALAACSPRTMPTLRVPLLACVLGETTGAAHRRTLADAGLPVFATPESAVRAFGQLVAQRRARAAAAELPSRRVLRLAPDQAAVTRILSQARAAGRDGLTQDEALDVLAAYGMPVLPICAVQSAEDAAAAAARLGFPVVLKRRRHGAPDASPGRLSKPGPGTVLLDLRDADAVRRAVARLGPAADGLLVQRQAGRARELRITMADDTVFGPVIGFGLGGTAAALLGDVAYELPPLNLALARAQIGRTRAAGLLVALHDQPAADEAAVADALVRVSQMLTDHPEIAAIDINPLFADAQGVTAADAWIGLRPAGTMSSFALTAYPAELAERFEARHETVSIRPIRPEDAEAHIALFRRLTPEDIRYRFFNMLRELPPEQIARMTQVDYVREMAFVAVRDGGSGAAGEVAGGVVGGVAGEVGSDTVGVGRLVREMGTPGGEFAVVVDPAMKGQGLARRLMERLLEWGGSLGMTSITGQVLAENAPMLAFMRRMGATIRRLPDEPDVMEAVIPVVRSTPGPARP